MNAASLAHAGNPAVGKDHTLVHRDGHRVAFLQEGRDERGNYLLIEHVWTRPGMMAGPHWHPVLTETFRVLEGRMRFRVDEREFFLGPGERITVRPEEVHRFWNTGKGRLRVIHDVRPPGHHRQMFELWHRLDLGLADRRIRGRTNHDGPHKGMCFGCKFGLGLVVSGYSSWRLFGMDEITIVSGGLDGDPRGAAAERRSSFGR